MSWLPSPGAFAVCSSTALLPLIATGYRHHSTLQCLSLLIEALTDRSNCACKREVEPLEVANGEAT